MKSEKGSSSLTVSTHSVSVFDEIREKMETQIETANVCEELRHGQTNSRVKKPVREKLGNSLRRFDGKSCTDRKVD